MSQSKEPIILAIDTATEACSAAVAIGDNITTRFEIAPREHTQLILTMMDEVLNTAGVKLTDIDAIAFGRGPGAFTGVRIATGVAHGVSLSVDKPLLPISTLGAIAQQVLEEQGAENCIAAIDARMGEVYWAKYIAKGSLMELQDEEAINAPEALLAVQGNEAWTTAGSGWDEYHEPLDVDNKPLLAHVDKVLPSAHYIARLAVEDWKQGKAVGADQAQPIYLRDKVADTIVERATAKAKKAS